MHACLYPSLSIVSAQESLLCTWTTAISILILQSSLFCMLTYMHIECEVFFVCFLPCFWILLTFSPCLQLQAYLCIVACVCVCCLVTTHTLQFNWCHNLLKFCEHCNNQCTLAHKWMSQRPHCICVMQFKLLQSQTSCGPDRNKLYIYNKKYLIESFVPWGYPCMQPNQMWCSLWSRGVTQPCQHNVVALCGF